MPIEIDKITADAATAAATAKPVTRGPKFFSSTLTGNGRNSVGLINQTVRPGRDIVGASAFSAPRDEITRKAKTTAGAITTHMIPMAPLLAASLRDNRDMGLKMAVPHVDDRFHVTANAPKLDFDVFVDLTPQGIIFHEDGAVAGSITKELNIQYRMEVYVVDKAQPSDVVTMIDVLQRRSHKEFAVLDWSYTPLDDIEDLIKRATAGRGVSGHSVSVNIDDLADWMGNYDVFERISRLADLWAGDELADVICDHISELFWAGTPSIDVLNRLALQLRSLETYNVSLEAYRKIHTTLSNTCSPDVALMFSKQNLSLLMSHTLEHLNQIKPQLSSPPQAVSGAAVVPAHFSTQQRNAVTTDDPLVLVQAGAGTGKSTVILGRIDHLVSRGVNPADVTVLSFTNAAADNIIAKNPNVGSMTISRMIHEIYTANYKHELSSIDTIINSLDIFYPQSDLAAAFRRRLMDVAKNANGAFTSMNTFIENHFDDVMAVLDRIGQTSLELEIIVCYQKIDTMIEPPQVKSRYLIIDEVQDNSIFEFIYVLKYVAKHKENMYIVGDSSQTLYEFRSSNPKALNALEGSGVFTTFKLTTNYRSNQEILDFANVSLSDIEANQYANIQLQANSLALPTGASFKEKVTLDYRPYPKLTAFREDLGGILRITVKEYIDGCLARGEQVAFLAFSRNEVTRMEEQLKVMYPTREVANLVSEKTYSTTVFSEFIKKFWNDVRQVPPANAAYTVASEVIKKLDQLTRNSDKAEKAVGKMVSDWWVTNSAAINGWVALHGAGQMSSDAFFDNLRQNLLDYEIRHNSIKQSLMNQKNKERKEKNLATKADLIVSTIHGCKGLEFDNVVVVHKYDSQMSEADKRMYYVAFTRAMNTEYILSYGTVKNARIESDYQLLLKALEDRDAANAARALASVGGAAVIGQDVDMSDDAGDSDAAAGVSAAGDSAPIIFTPVSAAGGADEEDSGADSDSGLLTGAVA